MPRPKPSPLTSERPKSLTKFFPRLLRVLTWVFYACFVVLWFKDNVDALKKFRVSYLVALVPLVIVVGVRLVRAMRKTKIVVRPKLDKTVLAILLLLLAATVVRWPYLMFGDRLVNGDDGISALMGKHIAEGKLPPICFYGQHYLGSLSSHFYALFFLVFGYSIPILKIATFSFYLGFIVIQFLLLKDAVSLSFAFVTSLFYSLPFGYLLLVSIDNSSAHGLVLFLGSVILFMATKVGFAKKTSWLPGLGFVIGLSFWTHQITASFILAAVLLLLFKARLGLRSIATLAVYGTLGGLPLLFQEIFDRFRLVPFLVGGEKGSFAADKVKTTIQNLKALLAPLNEDRLGTILLVVLLLGAASLLIMTVRSKGRSPEAIFLIFLVVFAAMYWFSRFSDKFQVRYLYPGYVVLPAVLLSPFYLLKSRLKPVFAAGFVVVVVMTNGWPAHVSFAKSVKDESLQLRQIVDALRATGEHFWLGDYWPAYSMTAISGENPVIDSFAMNRYLPYHLAHYDGNDRDNYIFFRAPGEAEDFSHLLTAFGIPFERNVVGDTSLFYKIGSRVFPYVLSETPPAVLPSVSVDRVREKDGYLEVVFKSASREDVSGFRINMEIPGYSAVSVAGPAASGEAVAMIPAPPRTTFPVKYELDFKALRIPSSAREFTFTRPAGGPAARTDPIVYLRGISGPVDRFGTTVRDCEKEVVFEILPPRSRTAKLRLILWNPFDFADLRWYGRYEQSVRVAVGDSPPVEILLRDIRNAVEIGLADAVSANRPVPVTLTFRYRSQFNFVPTQVLSAFLVRADLLD